MNNSFPKDCRLLSKKDFNSLRSDSTRLRSGFLVFIYKENSLGKPRLGLAISRKFGNAVKRNDLKRRVREKFRTTNFVGNNLDILVTVNQKAWSQRSDDGSRVETSLRKDIERGFSSLVSL
ncbi:MAG: ribonuclease P protein component [Halobacteriovoraceae bacterium]|nr:ribonuclease P protein component [Halobacteriovoraceae bacterium]